MLKRAGPIVVMCTVLLVHLVFLAETHHASEVKFFIFAAGTLVLVAVVAAEVLFGGLRLREAFATPAQKHVLLAVLVYLVVAAASILWAPYRVAAIFRTFEILLYVVWTLLVVVVLRTRRDVAHLTGLFLAAGVLMASAAFIFNDFGEQFWLPIGNPNWLAACLLIPMMLALEGVLANLIGRNRRLWAAGLYALAFALMAAVLALTGSESAEVSFLLALVVLPILLRVKRRRLIACTIVAAIVLAAAADLTLGNPGKLRAFARSKSVAIRLDMWRWSLDLAGRNPVSGLGAGGYLPNVSEVSARDMDRNPGYYADITVHAHNEPLEVLVELGILGLVAFLWPVGVLLFAVSRPARDGGADRLRMKLAALAAGWLAVFLQSLLTVGIRFWSVPVVFWTGLGLLTASLGLSARERGEEQPPGRAGGGRRVMVFIVVLLVLVAGVHVVIVRGFRASVAMKQVLTEKDPMKRIELLKTASRQGVFFVDRVRAHNKLGQIYYRLRKAGAASDEYKRVINLAGNYHDAELSVAANYLAQNPIPIDLAVKHLRRYARLRPARPATANILSRYFTKLSPGEARSEFDRLAKRYPRFGKLRVAYALIEPDETRTRELLTEALKLDRDDAHALFLFALLDWKEKRYDRARAWMTECYEMGFRTSTRRLAILPSKWRTGFPNPDELVREVAKLAPPKR